MKILFKKALSLMMCLCVLFSAGVWSFAEDSQEEPIEWIEIYTYEDLDDVRYDLTKNYKLMNDIDMTEFIKPGGDYDFYGQGWNPIGSKDVYGQTDFSGIFDGNGYTISGLRMNVTKFPAGTGTGVYCGLFTAVSGIIKNLTVSGNISVSDSLKNNYVGGITATHGGNGSLIENCTNIVSIDISSSNGYEKNGLEYMSFVGGVVGYGGGTIINCRNVAELSATSQGYYANSSQWSGCHNWVSGINGFSYNTCRVLCCINSGNITGTNCTINGEIRNESSSHVNGIVHYPKEVANCYNCGNVTACNGDSGYGRCYSSGVSLDGIVKNCYNIGTIIGSNCNYAISNSTSTNCYYLRGTGTTSEGATERTQAQMKRQITFQDWDFENVWTMEGRDDYFYPELRDVALITPDDVNRTPIDGTVAIDGEIEVGNTLTANVDEITPENAAVSYAWAIDGEQVSDTESYQIIESDIGKTITLTVLGTGDFRGKLTAELVLEKPHVHVEETIPAVDPTCTQTGLTQGKKCSECGEILVAQEEVAALGHNYNAVITNPNCTEAGYTTHTCSRCGDTYTSDTKSALGHDYNAVVTNPTCTEAGYTTHTCSRCGDTYTSDTESTLGHDYTAVATNPTCTEAGYTTHTCSRCSDSYVDGESSALGHTEPDSNGNCTRCGAHIKDVVNPDACPYCGQVHDGIFGRIVAFFHKVIYFIDQLF